MSPNHRCCPKRHGFLRCLSVVSIVVGLLAAVLPLGPAAAAAVPVIIPSSSHEFFNSIQSEAALLPGVDAGSWEQVQAVILRDLQLSPGWTALGEAQGDSFASVSSAGDVNGDGYADILVAAPGYAAYTGKVYAFYGGANGLVGTPASPAWSIIGEAPGDQFGTAVAGAGDVNGDGYADIVVGAPYWDNNKGKVYVFHGGAGGLSGSAATPAWSATGETSNSLFGVAVAGVGDVNGDGYDDVAAGAWGYRLDGDDDMRGKVYAFSGSVNGVTGSTAKPAWSATGEAPGNGFGSELAVAGDVNGDGYADIVVGAFNYRLPGDWFETRGKVYVFHGGASGVMGTALVPAWSATGEAQGDFFGDSLGSVGDVNGDGYGDLVVASPGYNGTTGKVYVFQGSAGGITGTPAAPAWSASGEAGGDYFGASAAKAGDVISDGYGDLVVAAPGYNEAMGKVYVFQGSAGGFTGTSATPAWSVTGENLDDHFGGSVAAAGDVNGDGYADVLVGAWGYDSMRGKVYAFHGAPMAEEPVMFLPAVIH